MDTIHKTFSIYIALNMTPNIDRYRVGAVRNLYLIPVAEFPGLFSFLRRTFQLYQAGKAHLGLGSRVPLLMLVEL